MELKQGDLVHFTPDTKAVTERNLLGGTISATRGHNGLITISNFIPIDTNKPVLWKHDFYYINKEHIYHINKVYSVWN